MKNITVTVMVFVASWTAAGCSQGNLKETGLMGGECPNGVRTQKSACQEPEQDTLNFNDLLNTAERSDSSRAEDERNTSREPGLEGDDVYLLEVKVQMENHLRLPRTVSAEVARELRARFWIKIGAAGSIIDWGWNKKSGHTEFDEMVERMMDDFMLSGGTLAFPEPPQRWRLKEINVRVDGSKILR